MSRKLLHSLLFGALIALSVSMVQPAQAAPIPPGCVPNPYNNAFADVTGDGLADAITVYQSNVVVRRAFKPGTGYNYIYGHDEPWTSNPYYGTRGTYFADVTGDGKADAIVVNDWGITVRRSNGNTFGPNELWTTAAPSDPFYGQRGTYFADVTGDGKADAIAVDYGAVRVRVSSVSPFSGSGMRFLGESTLPWATGAYYGDRGIYFADVTGPDADGKSRADLIVVGNSYITASSPSLVSPTFGTPGQMTSNPYYGDAGTYFADVDGDRKADAIAVNTGGITVRYSNGLGFNWPVPGLWPTSRFFGNVATFFADVNGPDADGKSRADAIAVNKYNVGSVNSDVRLRTSYGTGFWGEKVVLPSIFQPTAPFYSDLQPWCLS